METVTALERWRGPAGSKHQMVWTVRCQTVAVRAVTDHRRLPGDEIQPKWIWILRDPIPQGSL